MAKQTKQQTKKQTEEEAKIIQEVENDDTEEEEEEEEVENHDDDDDTDTDDDDEEYKKALLMIEMIKKKKTEKAQKKADAILNKIVNGAVYLQKVEEYEKIKNHADNLKKEITEYLETEKEANGFNLLVKTAKKSVGGGGSKTEPNTTTDIKKDLTDGKYDLYCLVVNGDNYKLCYDKNIYHFGNVSVPCGKKDNKTNYVLSYQYCVENKINTLNKIGNFVFGSSTNIYTKLKKF
tara:strand:- start:256 stop:960 length:705 start_codon:yes stop_codon:yes gene_type:complete